MKNAGNFNIILTDYIQYRADIRGFDISIIEDILRHSTEKYFDTVTLRFVAVGKHDNILVVIPYEKKENNITPVTIHSTTRQQIKFRIKTGRFINE